MLGKADEMRIYSDGASRGNPGPAAIAVKIVDGRGATIRRLSSFLGRRTNNEAEYEALIAGLKLASGLTKGSIECFLDSELVVKQLNGEYEVRNSRLNELWRRVRELEGLFIRLRFNHISRTDRDMQEVDRLANHALDTMLR